MNTDVTPRDASVSVGTIATWIGIITALVTSGASLWKTAEAMGRLTTTVEQHAKQIDALEQNERVVSSRLTEIREDVREAKTILKQRYGNP